MPPARIRKLKNANAAVTFKKNEKTFMFSMFGLEIPRTGPMTGSKTYYCC
jgi:hypothetical protein